MSKTKDTSTKGDLIFWGVVVGISAAIGAIAGLGLSVTALPLLIISGIVASIPAVLLAAFSAYCIFQKGELDYKTILGSLCFCAISVATGVGLAAASSAIFPGAMVGMGAAALAGAVIGAIAPIASLFATDLIIMPIAAKVNEYIISPTIEKIKAWSSKENQSAV